MNGKENEARPGKRLALFFDGTWNEPADHTNVRRLRLMLADWGRDGVPQESFYDEGVGTRWYDRLSGGAFGAGLPDNVRNGYRWLIERYNAGDEIFVFGFSRGAFTARSLAGLIARCGLLQPDAPISFAQLYERYQKGDKARPIYELIRDKANSKNFDFDERMLLVHSHYRRNFIKMVGVWDTVGSIGIPFGNMPGISRRTLRFHNTRLSTAIEHSYQALALDEYRQPYWAVLWTHFVPEGADPKQSANDSRVVEQRWFIGAHANLGGGYRTDLLPQRPLAWLQKKAMACGLGFRSLVRVNDDDLDSLPRDSYSEFLAGFWKIATLWQRYVRWVMADPVWKPSRKVNGRLSTAGWVQTANERIDLSVFRHCQHNPGYCSRSLQKWAERSKLDLKQIIAQPERFPEYWQDVTTPGIENRIKPTAPRSAATTQ
jgi:uncharacterized protein (DUF2235 family)